MAETLRVVLDTNTVLSALLFVQGRLAPLLAAWQSGIVTSLLCAQKVEEPLRVLAYPKFKLTSEEREELLADNLPFGQVIAPRRENLALPVCRDEKDQVFLELAAVGAAQWLVTGDRDLLSLGERVQFQPIEPALAIEMLTERR